MESKKMNKNNKKKMMTGLMIGAVALSAPFTVMAATGLNEGNYNNNTDNIAMNGGGNYNDRAIEKMDLLKETLQLQIEHANVLIDSLDVDDNVDVDELRDIVDEFAQLESSIEELNIDGALAEDMRSLYFEIKDESRTLSSEFRDLIENAFSEEEREVLREELQAEKQALKQNYNLGFKNSDNAMRGMSNEYDSLTQEERDEIRAEMRWTNQQNAANGDGVKQGTGKGSGQGTGTSSGKGSGQRLMSN